MASFEDYDEFGNYIGGDLESDEDEDMQQDTFGSAQAQQQQATAPLEGFDDEQPAGADSMALMEIDGSSHKTLLNNQSGN
jgi:U5 small nuclear ribonucleoprotein component